jgi:hypothetical protein
LRPAINEDGQDGFAMSDDASAQFVLSPPLSPLFLWPLDASDEDWQLDELSLFDDLPVPLALPLVEALHVLWKDLDVTVMEVELRDAGDDFDKNGNVKKKRKKTPLQGSTTNEKPKRAFVFLDTYCLRKQSNVSGYGWQTWGIDVDHPDGHPNEGIVEKRFRVHMRLTLSTGILYEGRASIFANGGRFNAFKAASVIRFTFQVSLLSTIAS